MSRDLVSIIEWTVFTIIILINARQRAIWRELFLGPPDAHTFCCIFMHISKGILAAASNTDGSFLQIHIEIRKSK